VPVNSHDISAGLFVRGLTNLKAQLIKAEEHTAANGIAAADLLNASLAVTAGAAGDASPSPYDLYAYTLAAHIHWAAEGARLAIVRLLGTTHAPDPTILRSQGVQLTMGDFLGNWGANPPVA
jgi:hypothetical protein